VRATLAMNGAVQDVIVMWTLVAIMVVIMWITWR
jgi:hypothetical protein